MVRYDYYPDGSIKSIYLVGRDDDDDEAKPDKRRTFVKAAADDGHDGDAEELYEELYGGGDDSGDAPEAPDDLPEVLRDLLPDPGTRGF